METTYAQTTQVSTPLLFFRYAVRYFLCGIFFLSSLSLARAQINLYGTSGDQHFTQVIPDGPNYYVLGQDGSHATITRVLSSGVWDWTQKLDIPSGLLDAIVMPNGHLLFVGFTLQFPNKSIIGQIDRNKNLMCLNTFDSPGSEGIAQIESIDATTYLAVGFQSDNTPQDIVIYKISTATPGCVVLQKYLFINLPGADYGHDIVVTGPNSFLVCGSDANSSAVIYHYDLTLGQLGGVIEPNQYEYVDMEPVSSDLLVAANSLNGGRPHIVRFDSDLFPIWESEIFGLSSVNQILIGANDKIYVVGTANNINRTVVLKLDDCIGTCPPTSDWSGKARYLDNGSSAYIGGFLALSNTGLAFADGREGSGGIGMDDGFLGITDADMTSMECMLEHQIDLGSLSTVFASPEGDLLFSYEFPIQDDLEANMQMWEYKEVCESVSMDSCVCGIPDFELQAGKESYQLFCLPHGSQTPIIPCPSDDIIVSGVFDCIDAVTGKPCEIENEVTYILNGPDGSPIDGGTTQNLAVISFPPNYFQTPGTYQLTITKNCGVDTCICVLDWIVECDTCCTDQLAFLDDAADVETFGTLGDCELSFAADGLTDCMQITYDWNDGPPTGPITGNNILVSHTYPAQGTYVVCYTIEEVNNGEVCWEYFHCDTIDVLCSDACCSDNDLFCQNVMNAVSVTTNNSLCKVTLNINNLPECDSILNIVWGDLGGPDPGPYGSSDMPMHTYTSSGTYIISYLAVEYDFNTGQPCFQKQFSDTVTLACQGCQCGEIPFSNIVSHTTDSSIPFRCGDATKAIPCPPGDEDLIFSFDFVCDDPGCTPAGVNWELIRLPSTVVSSGISTITSQYTLTVPRQDLSVTGNYQLVLSGICNGDTCKCELAFTIEEPCEAEEPACCAYEINLINLYQDGRIKKVRITSLCETKICCADPDDWAQNLSLPNYIEWFPADGSGFPYGAVIDNDFILFLDNNSSSQQEFQVEWFDFSDNIVSRDIISMDCNGSYNEDEDWLTYTSKTALNDPNLYLFAVREPDADEEITECDYDLRSSCPGIQYRVTCNGGNSYNVLLAYAPNYESYDWEVSSTAGIVFNNDGTQYPDFIAQTSGSYVVSVAAESDIGDCSNTVEIIIPDIQPEFTAQLLPCGPDVKFTPRGWDIISDISNITWGCSPIVPGFPSQSNVPFTFTFPQATVPVVDFYTVTMVIQDKFGCSHQISHVVEINPNCQPSFQVEYSLCQNECPQGNTIPVDVKFTNTSIGGTCPGIVYTYDFGDGNFSPPFNETQLETHHQYLINCPAGNVFPVTLTMNSPGTPCVAQKLMPIEVKPCDVFISTVISCPDGKYVFSANVPGEWSLPGSLEIAPWPYSDKPDAEGHRRFVAVRYPQGIHFVTFTGYCDNGGKCTVNQKIFVQVDCFAKNDKIKKTYPDPHPMSTPWVIKNKFRQLQILGRHRIVATTIFKKRIDQGWYAYRKRSIAAEIQSDFTGMIFKSDCIVGCNYFDPDNVSDDSSILYNKKKAKAVVTGIGKFKSWLNSLESTHRVLIDANDPTSEYIFNYWLGRSCEPFKWNCPPD